MDDDTALMEGSRRWWAETRDDPDKLVAWLFAQYRGEATAVERILGLRDLHAAPGSRGYKILTVIAGQERRHAGWVGELLVTRGCAPELRGEAPARYWQRALPGITDLETGCAAGAHAEHMRLVRISVIAGDEQAPADVRAVFAKILPEEKFHERAFRSLATVESLERTRGDHALGLAALGLGA